MKTGKTKEFKVLRKPGVYEAAHTKTSFTVYSWYVLSTNSDFIVTWKESPSAPYENHSVSILVSPNHLALDEKIAINSPYFLRVLLENQETFPAEHFFLL